MAGTCPGLLSPCKGSSVSGSVNHLRETQICPEYLPCAWALLAPGWLNRPPVFSYTLPSWVPALSILWAPGDQTLKDNNKRLTPRIASPLVSGFRFGSANERCTEESGGKERGEKVPEFILCPTGSGSGWAPLL